jgi:hypothetical protein
MGSSGAGTWLFPLQCPEKSALLSRFADPGDSLGGWFRLGPVGPVAIPFCTGPLTAPIVRSYAALDFALTPSSRGMKSG